MGKYLIINADDFGMCAAHNIATKELLLSGAVTSATVMAPCPFARDAAECEEIKAITPLWHRRVWEHRLFSDPETKEYIRALGIKLISYKDVKIIRGEK